MTPSLPEYTSRRLAAPSKPKHIRLAIDFTVAFTTFYQESMELGNASDLSKDDDLERLTTFSPDDLVKSALDVLEDMICRGNMNTGIGYHDIAALEHHDDIRAIMYPDVHRRIHNAMLIDYTTQYTVNLLKECLSRAVTELFAWAPDYRPISGAIDPIIYRVLTHLVIMMAGAMVYVGKEFQLTPYELINYHRFSYQAASYNAYSYVLTLDGL